MPDKRRDREYQGDLSVDSLSRIIEMAWEDRTPFEAVDAQFGPVSYTHLTLPTTPYV